jgi:hypothetical protein
MNILTKRARSERAQPLEAAARWTWAHAAAAIIERLEAIG